MKEELEKLRHFYGLDKTLEDILSCEYIKARFGKIPDENFKNFEKLANESKEHGIDLMFFEFDDDSEYKWGIYFAKVEDMHETDRIFSKMHFKEIEMTSCPQTPKQRALNLEENLKEIEKKLKDVEGEIAKVWNEQKDMCMRFYKKIEKLNTYFEIKTYAARYGDSFILVGWVPEENAKSFSENAQTIEGLECSLESGSDLLGNSPPIKLKNKRIFKPFEFFVSTYGMPCYNEVDPTVFVAITYPLLFGIMFADLGQGLLLAFVGWIMAKFKGITFGKIMMSCGLSSAIFGTVFGSVFGFEHALDPFYKNVFGLKEKPIEVMSASSSNLIIYTAVGIGIFLLICSMLLGVYSMIKRRNVGEAIFSPNGVCGLVFYVSLIFLLLDSMILHTGITGMLYVILLIIVPLVLIMFKEILVKLVEKKKDWKPESWAEYISQSFFELFEVLLSYVTNTMSFLRVGAFVLVHAGMMMVVFTIAEMFSGLGYLVALILGNIFVVVLEALLSGIQVLRLEFYEMFSKFFEGQGRAYAPVVAEKYAK